MLKGLERESGDVWPLIQFRVSLQASNSKFSLTKMVPFFFF